ncbi:TRAP transporter small permease [Pseudonocardia nematodicida]|uniref:TRAP transporter small permease n=1 Tax=Pseudonocardia nematodicida TaxID=1206997 RepID=A0ABV1KDE0_9PSEU
MTASAHPPETEDAPEAPDLLERNSRAYRLLVNVERAVACALLLGVLAAVLLQVVTRYVFGTPLSWTEEIARFLLVWLTFVAAGYVMSRRLHIVVDLLVDRLGARGSRAVDVFAALVVLVTSATMAIAGAGFAAGSVALLAPATSLPLTVVYSAAVAGFGLLFLHGVLNTWLAIRHPEEMPGAVDTLTAGTTGRNAP